MAVLLSDGPEGAKWMEVGKPNARFDDRHRARAGDRDHQRARLGRVPLQRRLGVGLGPRVDVARGLAFGACAALLLAGSGCGGPAPEKPAAAATPKATAPPGLVQSAPPKINDTKAPGPPPDGMVFIPQSVSIRLPRSR